MGKWFAIFRAGKHTDSKGREREWTEEDIDRIVELNNGQEVPLVIGHPEVSSPAYGWATEFKRDGKVLYAKPKQLVEEFAEWVKKGLWKKVSISVRPKDFSLRHIGFLGATPPAVQGLPSVEFSDGDDAVTIEFSEGYALNTIGYIFQRMREWIISKFGQETADQIVGNNEIDYLKNIIQGESVQSDTNSFSINNALQPPVGAIHKLPQSGEEEEKKGGDDMEKAELETQLREKDAQLSDFAEREKTDKARIRELETKARRDGFALFCDSDEMKDKITPAMKPAALDFMEILSGVETYEFAEGGGRVKKSPAEAFKGFLKALPKAVDFSEVATKEKATDQGAGDAGAKLDAKAREKMTADKDLSYSAAFAEAQKENPELAQEYAVELRGGK